MFKLVLITSAVLVTGMVTSVSGNGEPDRDSSVRLEINLPKPGRGIPKDPAPDLILQRYPLSSDFPSRDRLAAELRP